MTATFQCTDSKLMSGVSFRKRLLELATAYERLEAAHCQSEAACALASSRTDATVADISSPERQEYAALRASVGVVELSAARGDAGLHQDSAAEYEFFGS